MSRRRIITRSQRKIYGHSKLNDGLKRKKKKRRAAEVTDIPKRLTAAAEVTDILKRPTAAAAKATDIPKRPTAAATEVTDILKRPTAAAKVTDIPKRPTAAAKVTDIPTDIPTSDSREISTDNTTAGYSSISIDPGKDNRYYLPFNSDTPYHVNYNFIKVFKDDHIHVEIPIYRCTCRSTTDIDVGGPCCTTPSYVIKLKICPDSMNYGCQLYSDETRDFESTFSVSKINDQFWDLVLKNFLP